MYVRGYTTGQLYNVFKNWVATYIVQNSVAIDIQYINPFLPDHFYLVSSYKGGLWCQKNKLKFSGPYLVRLPGYWNFQFFASLFFKIDTGGNSFYNAQLKSVNIFTISLHVPEIYTKLVLLILTVYLLTV